MSDPCPTTCRACGAQIAFVRTAAGRQAPMNVEDGFVTGVSHFATCPQANRFTRRRIAKPKAKAAPVGPRQGVLL